MITMRPGDPVKPFALPSVDGSVFHSSEMEGKRYMLSFFRFATCPMCNMRMHELVTNYDEIQKHLEIIAIFDSPLRHLRRNMAKHDAPFPILADPDRDVYDMYGIRHSAMGVVKGVLTRIPTLAKGFSQGYIPLTAKGDITTMPAEFIIDENGIITTAYYGQDEGDHLPLATLLQD